MEPFLKQTADHYFSSGDLEGKCFVFPNRRSMAFFRKWACGYIAGHSSRPVVLPRMCTINDFFTETSGAVVADRITLLVELYGCYRELNPEAEPLDDFIFWGDVLLADFNDVDKYLVDPAQLYTNLSDYKSIQDSYSYLSDNQREAIDAFINGFNARDRRVTVNLENGRGTDAKARFTHIWNLLLPLYRSFNERLSALGLSYEGMVYRKLATKVRTEPVADVLAGSFPSCNSFVFVGLNALNECEKTLLSKMRDAGIAEFCWDYSGDMIRHPLNRSSVFMQTNVGSFPPAFVPDGDGLAVPEFNVVSVPSSVGQVKLLPEILGRCGVTGGDADVRCTEDCAIVLPDESLLISLLNSLPEDVDDINVTMGFPLSSGDVYSLVRELLKLQLHVRGYKDGSWRFYHKNVWTIISNGLVGRAVAGDTDFVEKTAVLKKSARFYLKEEDFAFNELLRLIFRPVVKDPAAASEEQFRILSDYLLEVLGYVAPKLGKDPSMALELDLARECWRAVKGLKSKNLPVSARTYARLLDSIMGGITVPFNGEPLKGLQIMGPLETRALDFRNVVILSCNEGTFPRKNVSASFIPPELRKGFGLPGYEFQDAVWAYYFYRLISRAEKVWMLYDSRTEGLKRGEESRYIKQLRYHFRKPMNMFVAESAALKPDSPVNSIKKTAEHVDKIRKMTLSPTAVINYIQCPARFFFHSVEGLRKVDEVSEQMDASMIGNVYHNTMRALFIGEKEMMSRASFDKLEHNAVRGMDEVTGDYLSSWLKRRKEIRDKVDSLICAEMHTDEITGRDLVTAEVITRYVIETIKSDIALLKRAGASSFRITGLEMPLSAQLYGLKFYGVADRVDSLAPGVIRLVDYKTGQDDPETLKVGKDAVAFVEKLFDPDDKDFSRRKAAIQFHIYDRMLEASGRADGCEIFNSMYSTRLLFNGGVGIERIDAEASRLMDERLDMVAAEMLDVDVPFNRCSNEDCCRYCDFKVLCGRN